VLGTDITTTTGNVFHDLVSLTLTAGTWILFGMVDIVANNAVVSGYARFHDGTNDLGGFEVVTAASPWWGTIEGHTVYVAAGTVTLKLQAASSSTANTLTFKATTFQNSSPNATRLTALKVA
jgi:hypothetical protein